MALFPTHFVTVSVLGLVLAWGVSGQLSSTFYSSSCPTLESMVRLEMTQAINREARLGASILRLFFHDCFVNV